MQPVKQFDTSFFTTATAAKPPFIKDRDGIASPPEMKAKLAHFRGENPESPINKIYDGPLHNSNISYFILRKVHFEIKRENMPINGFVFSNGKFNFWISSSSQCDLSVVYEEKDKEP